MPLQYTIHSLVEFITGPVALATFWVPLALTAIFGLLEWRRRQLKLPIWLVLLSFLLLPATVYMSWWQDYGSFQGWHILPLPLVLVLVFVWMRGRVSTSGALAVIYTHVLTVDIYATYRLLLGEPEHPSGWMRGIGAGGWSDYLLLLPVFLAASFSLVQYAVLPWLIKKYPADAARILPGWISK